MTALLLKLAALLAVFACVFLLVQQLSLVVVNSRRDRTRINQRLTLLAKGLGRERVVEIIRRGSQVVSADRWYAGLFNRFVRLNVMAGVAATPANLLVFAAAAATITFLVMVMVMSGLSYQITFARILLALAVSLALCSTLPLLWLSRRAQKRLRLMEEQFPEALDVFTRALRSGHPVAAAVDLLTGEMPDPIGSEFGLVFDEISYGADFNSAVYNMADRWDLPDVKMFAVSLAVQSETGGNLAEILTNLSQTIRDRASLYLKVRALSAEGRMTAWVLTVMPVLTFLVLFAVNPRFFLDVAGDPIFTWGFTLLIALYFAGAFWLRRLVQLKV